MKREIKFRAWNEKDNRWATEQDFKREGLFINYDIRGNGEFEIQSDCPVRGYGRFILNQFTGLKDKNGKEIYEGDIVNAIRVGGIKQSFKTVEYKQHGFWLNDEEFGWEGEGLYHWTMLEVVGNIYENPELS